MVQSPEIQYIRLSSGEVRLTWPGTITELHGLDISNDAVTMCLGSMETPGNSPIAPDLIIKSIISVSDYMKQGGSNPFNLPLNTTLHQLAVQQLIGGVSGVAPAAGSYWVWARLPDQTEIEWFRFHKVIVS